MSEYTPGPWVYQYFPEEDTWCIGYPGVDGMIAMAVPNEHLPTAVSAEANARLIAAAPDLLEACEKALEAIHFTREYVGYQMLPAIEGWSWYDATKLLETTIARARSDQP